MAVKEQGSLDLDPRVVKYFQDRRISERCLRENKIGNGLTFFPGSGTEKHAIQFRYYVDGQLVNVKYRSGDKEFKQEKGGQQAFYRYDEIKDPAPGSTLVITEGEIDALSLIEAGVQYATSVPSGASAVDTGFLDHAKPVLDKYERIILAVDNDAPGRKLEDELSRRIGTEKCWRVKWPEGCKDANDVLSKRSALDLSMVISEAKPFPVSGLFDVLDFEKELDVLYDKGIQRGMSTGWPEVDDIYTVHPCYFTVITGIPSSGKSTFVDNMLVNMAKLHGCKFAICSPEQWPLERHAASIIEKKVGKPFGTGPKRMTKEEMHEARDWMHNHFHFIAPDDDEMSVEKVLEKTRAAVYRHGIDGLVLDPWNEFTHDTDEREDQYISRMLSKIRRFARVNRIHIWIVAHPKTMYKGDGGRYPVVTPYDISGGSMWYNKPDAILSLYRVEGEELVEVIVCKARFHEIGERGKRCKLVYQRDSGLFLPM